MICFTKSQCAKEWSQRKRMREFDCRELLTFTNSKIDFYPFNKPFCIDLDLAVRY